jgi:hypothetical protein
MSRGQIVVQVFAEIRSSRDVIIADSSDVAHADGAWLVVTEGQVDEVVDVRCPRVLAHDCPTKHYSYFYSY